MHTTQQARTRGELHAVHLSQQGGQQPHTSLTPTTTTLPALALGCGAAGANTSTCVTLQMGGEQSSMHHPSACCVPPAMQRLPDRHPCEAILSPVRPRRRMRTSQPTQHLHQVQMRSSGTRQYMLSTQCSTWKRYTTVPTRQRIHLIKQYDGRRSGTRTPAGHVAVQQCSTPQPVSWQAKQCNVLCKD